MAEVSSRTVILGVTASDAHAVANHLIAFSLRDEGFDVVNLGVNTTVEEFFAALAENPHAEAMVIGSINGHAYEDLIELPEVRAATGIDCPIILGGNLSVGSRKSEDYLRRLFDLGIDHILQDADEIVALLDKLHAAKQADRAPDDTPGDDPSDDAPADAPDAAEPNAAVPDAEAVQGR